MSKQQQKGKPGAAPAARPGQTPAPKAAPGQKEAPRAR